MCPVAPTDKDGRGNCSPTVVFLEDRWKPNNVQSFLTAVQLVKKQPMLPQHVCMSGVTPRWRWHHAHNLPLADESAIAHICDSCNEAMSHKKTGTFSIWCWIVMMTHNKRVVSPRAEFRHDHHLCCWFACEIQLKSTHHRARLTFPHLSSPLSLSARVRSSLTSASTMHAARYSPQRAEPTLKADGFSLNPLKTSDAEWLCSIFF